MSVDTYLQRKNMTQYQKTEYEGIQVMISPALAQQARAVHLDLKRFLFWTHYTVDADPLRGHFHGPACTH